MARVTRKPELELPRPGVQPREPVSDGAGGSPTVWLVTPVCNNAVDLAALLGDLRVLEPGVRLRGVVVDNASAEPIDPAALGFPDWLELLRLPTNSGGSGGYNAGMTRALRDEADRADFVWLVDADARVRPDTLSRLLRCFENEPDALAVGPALEEPGTIGMPEDARRVHELGGRVRRWNGQFGSRVGRRKARGAGVVECDYLAACCALVRAEAARDAGLFSSVFLNGDDVEWFGRLKRICGGRVLADASARAGHPRFDRHPTWQRYYQARNAFGPMAELGLGWGARFRRGLLEARRAINLAVTGREDLRSLGERGIDDAIAGRVSGAAVEALVFERWRPYSELPGALREFGLDGDGALLAEAERCGGLSRDDFRRTWFAAGWRLLRGARRGVACVPSFGGTHAWARAGVLVHCDPEGFVIRSMPGHAPLRAAARAGRRGIVRAWRAAWGATSPFPLAPLAQAGARATLSVVVLSYNRKAALERTLDRLLAQRPVGDGEVIVVDNASADGSAAMVRERFPGVRLLELGRNLGVEGFNRGAQLATGELLLILDDDAWPEPAGLERAIGLLEARPELAAVTLNPRHPSTRASEWRFAALAEDGRDDWPAMGCGNLVRRRDWERAGGYAEAYFLWRNDTDLAMKLLAMGRGVRFEPGMVVWHDSPHAREKTKPWLRRATRNWVWLTRRHARGGAVFGGAALGWLWAHRLAGADLSKHGAVLRGGLSGLFEAPPPLPRGAIPRGDAYARLLRLQAAARGRRAVARPDAAV